MTLRLYDTLTRQKRDFVPADPKRVTMYVCGPTVYNHVHIGNARPVVVFDVLFRLLRALYGEDAVVYARNITDVDDKINKRAAEEGVDIKVITDRYTAYYHEQMAALGALPPTLEPRATRHIDDMLAMIATLVERGHAYAAEGHVLFDTAAYPDYGRLSGRPLEDMIAGARVEVAPYKRHPADFVLWKPSKPGEPVWESPFGPGRPGWHIECSAMIAAVLGAGQIDIHGGGIDLTFPHHENERAQSVCAHDHGPDGPAELARYWLHNGFLDFDGEKMSKSLGNVALPHDLLKKVPGEVLRWALLSGHYRQPLDWTESLIEQSRKTLDRIYEAWQAFSAVPIEAAPPLDSVVSALCDDLNTPKAQSEFGRFVRSARNSYVHGAGSMSDAVRAKSQILATANLLGYLKTEPEKWLGARGELQGTNKINSLIEQRERARRTRNWPKADEVRDKLNALWVKVADGPEGSSWRIEIDEKNVEKVAQRALESYGVRLCEKSSDIFDFVGLINDRRAYVEVKTSFDNWMKFEDKFVSFLDKAPELDAIMILAAPNTSDNGRNMRRICKRLRSRNLKVIGMLFDGNGTVDQLR